MMRSTSTGQPKTTQSRATQVRGVRRMLEKFLLAGAPQPMAKRGRLLLEPLEQRQLLAGDLDLLFTDGSATAAETQTAAQTAGVHSASHAEGEAAPDLQQFAKDLAAAGVDFYGAEWCPHCTTQRQLFADGRNDLPFIEVTGPDRQLSEEGVAQGITQYPTWIFPNGTRLLGVQSLETLSQTAGVPIPTSDQPSFDSIGNLTVGIGSPLHVPVDAYDPGDGPLTVTVSVADPSLLEATVLTGNRSVRIDMNGYGDMVFELFEDRAPVASGRFIELAEAGFYNDKPATEIFDGIIFHRVIDNFMIQGGDPTGTGTSGSSLGNFDDDFHPDLQHNREGVLSYAKTTDDTNNSQFFITEVPTRHLDFNHSVFGQLVEGFDVREEISHTAVNASDRPSFDIQINKIEVIDEDTENAVVMLKAAGTATGTTAVTFTVTDPDGNSYSETVQVTVAADTANSQPFLMPIATPAVTPRDSSATLQLASMDIEGDAVGYFAQAVSAANSQAVSVDSASGLVTVTPPAGFTGTTIDVQVGVYRAFPTTQAEADEFDSQTVTFRFEAESVLATPTAVDLLAASDSGSSNDDNLTNVASLTFVVSGVTNGATVELVNTNTGSVVGTGTATGSSASITTDNIATLGDGTYPIAARQRVGSEISGLSPSITIIYDHTSPSSVISSAATQANVGRAFRSDLISPEEGSGLVYGLSSSPAGASIDAGSGVINWTPTSAQLGNQTFSLSLTDAAGNVRTESFTVNVAGEPLVDIKLEVTDLQGNPISSLAVGQKFLLNFIGGDARSRSLGVFAAHADILFNQTLVRQVPGTSIVYDDNFTLPKGTVSSGLIDELGAVSSRTGASNVRDSLIATVQMEALAAGNVNIRSEPADDRNSEVLLFGEDEQVPAESVAYGSVTLAIGQNFTLGTDTLTVAEDSATRVINVLANDTIVTGGGTLSVVSVTQPTAGGTVTLSGGQVSFTPAADFHGEAAFTYRVSNGSSQQDGNVLVTVTPVNDPPTAAPDNFVVDFGSTSITLDVLINDDIAPDVGETLTITAAGATDSSSSGGGATASGTTAAGGTVAIASDGRSLSYTPPAGYTGADSFTYTISDSELTAQATASIMVENTDDPPTAVDDAFPITGGAAIIEGAAEATYDVMANDTRDADNQSFLISSVGTPDQGGSARVSSDGTQFFYQPATNFFGSEQVSYTIRDTGGGTSTATVTFTITGENDPPPILNRSVSFNRGGATEFTAFQLTDLPANVDGNETLSISTVSTTTTAGGTARIDATTGTIFYTPPASTFTGSDSLTYSISDGTLTSSGTITINVADYSERNIVLTGTAEFANLGGAIRLRGTNLLGDAVDLPLTVDSSGTRFNNVLPGDYTIEIAALPFLQNASLPQQIAVTSAADDGDTTIEINVGRLKPEYVSIRDWLGSSPRQSLMVVVAPGQTGLMATRSAATETIDNPVVELDEAGTSLTIRGTATDSTTQTSQNVEATLSTEQISGVQLRGEIDGMRLYKISVEASDVTFLPSTTSVTTQSISPATQQAAMSGASAVTLGETQAEGESIVADSVTQLNIQVPAASNVISPAIASPRMLETSDVRNAQATLDSTSTAKISDASLVDSAMEDVAESLTIQSAVADRLAEDQTLIEQAIDSVLASNL